MAIEQVHTIPVNCRGHKMQWQKSDTTWMLSIYGTAVGAGTLFLPINAGINGFLPLVILAFLAWPMTHFSHRGLSRFVLSGSNKKADITHVVDEHFGHFAGQLLTFLYFFAIYPIVLIYSIGITNTANSFLKHQLAIQPPSRVFTSIVLLLLLMAIIRLGQKTIIKTMSMLVYPFVVVLLALGIYLIPHWNMSVFSHHLTPGFGSGSLLHSLLVGIPVVIFSFNHAAIISSFSLAQRKRYGCEEADQHANWILKYAHLMMVVTVLFFVFSCVLSLSPADLAKAKSQNISILSYLANHFSNPLITYAAPIVAFIAIAKSFLGHYIGASEGLHGIIKKQLRRRSIKLEKYQIYLMIDLFMVLTCWIVASLNPSILGLIEILGGPVTAALLFLMPMYTIYKVPAMQRYKQPLSDGFIIIIGMIAILAILYGLLF